MIDVTIVELPKLYENMDEATIGPWQVKEGQWIAAGDVLVELVTDKTVVEFESPVAGTVLKIYGTEKSTVPQGYALCAIGPKDASAPDLSGSNESKVAAHLQASAGGIDVSSLAGLGASSSCVKPSFKAAPAAKIYARQQGVDLAEVAAFCGREMIHRKDVEDYLARKGAGADSSSVSGGVAIADAEVGASSSSGVVSAVGSPGRVALVTGATGGIGSAVVRRLAADDVSVAIHYHTDKSGAQALCSELRGQGASCEIFQSDLSGDVLNAQKLVDAVTACFGHLDILVNNAGCLADSPMGFMSDEQWGRVMELCLSVPFRLMRACAMNMARRRWGRIVNMSSDAGRMGSANRSNYSSAKEGLCGLTRSAALEYGALGVRVNAVSPGFIETPMTAVIPEKRKTELVKTIPARRFGRAEEVAELVSFLCSEKSDYITGQVISINGGLCM